MKLPERAFSVKYDMHRFSTVDFFPMGREAILNEAQEISLSA